MKKIFPLFAVIIVLVLAVCSFHIIPTGYTGVKTSFGQIQETTIQSGKLNFCIPFVQSIHKVNNKQQDKHNVSQKPYHQACLGFQKGKTGHFTQPFRKRQVSKRVLPELWSK